MSTPKHLIWHRETRPRRYRSDDGAFEITRDGADWCLWYGIEKNILAGRFNRLKETQSHAQSMRDAGNA